MDDCRTVWCGNLSDQVTEELLYELFLQAAPVEMVKIPTDKDGKKMNYGFITFKHQESIEYALQLLNGIRLFDRYLKINYRHNKISNELSASSSDSRSINNPINISDVHYRSSPNRSHILRNIKYLVLNNRPCVYSSYGKNSYQENINDSSNRRDREYRSGQ